ncbi:DUF3300 domain-containing protein [Bordetella genomosp. 13]|uniref:DUF3300 domain-containing protein n=1 Tax=Bordetella genomosp. 13 TaxID=463040 RepID=A0A1W6Z9Y9_9BORD|nr:DUF3300 domain-containing protein [Bordetella genomosp. 13]ARP94193.1 hypothetical protein CAL15_07240 [Bordetella genomosp. 13]
MVSWYGRGVRAVLFWLVLMSATPAGAASDAQTPPPFKPEEIEALAAPIALYPDPLLSQVLMASTYPLEIVHAARWSKDNPSMRGDAAVKAVEGMPWDASVKSLVAFPQVLEPMNEKLDWTQKLGDAFLAQPADVFAAIQRLRGRAQDAGNLETNTQQKVIVEPAPTQAGGQTQVVRIESADPEVIYVPAYNPTVVYGAWSYPSYPPTYWPPSPAYYPGTALVSGLAWGVGLAAAGAIFSDCDWGSNDIDIDYNKVTNIDRNFDQTKVNREGGRWQHDASHRQGVAYRDNATRQQYAGGVPGADRRAEYRGREAGSGAGGLDREAVSNRAGAANRAAGADRPAGASRAAGADRPTASNRAAGADRSTVSNRPAAADRSAASNRAAAADRAGAAGRSTSTDRAASANRSAGGQAGQAGGMQRAGGGATARAGDSAFTGVGSGGAAAQRSYDRGRASAHGASGGRAGGGGARGGGGRR